MTTAAAKREGGATRVLLIDDDQDDFFLVNELLAEIPDERYELTWVDDYDAGLEAVLAGKYDVHLLDYRLGARNGLEMLHELRALECPAPVILLTGQGELEVDRAAMVAGAADFIEKNRLDATRLERSIRYALQKRRAESELEHKVRERTAQLERANAALQQEIAVRKRAEDALREADHNKDEFLATLAHELRNPLAPIRNALEIMRLSRGRAEAIEEAQAMMDRQVRLMVRLIDDLLDVSRITRNKLSLTLEKLELTEIIETALEISRPLIEKAGLALDVEMPDTAIWVEGDRVRLSQVFSNLLNNSAKYTEPGGRVGLIAKREGREAVVRVTDTGVGIPAEMLPKVFEMFTQVDRSLNRAQGGLGIGLGLVARLVEMHGGHVEAFSEGTGRGAEFVVRLPVLVDKSE
jgi:signal transduction histidine kinase